MWLHLQATDKNGKVVWEDGVLAQPGGELVRTDQTKGYEQEILADGYDFIDEQAKDLDGDGSISTDELEKAQRFHFVLMNKIVKDNRIPPKGYNKTAYQKDGAFIVPAETYADGQYWDITRYRLEVPSRVRKKITITATLKYQTFNREYAEFLRDHDHEATQKDLGRARNLPEPFATNRGVSTWGETLHALWLDSGNGPPVSMASATRPISVRDR